jgi:hypothetical protein
MPSPVFGTVQSDHQRNTSAVGMNTPNIPVTVGGPPVALSYLAGQLTGATDTGWLPLIDWRFLDAMDHTAGSGSPMIRLAYNTTPGIKGNGELLQLVCGTSADSIAINNNFFTCFEPRASVSNNLGGTSMVNTYGQFNVMNPVGSLEAGATFVNVAGMYENDMEVKYGASASLMHMGQSARFAHDFGKVGDPTIPAYAMSGRIGLMFNSSLPQVDATSAASVTASAGKNLPPFRAWNTFGQGEWTFDANSALFEAWPQIYQNTNSCTAGTANCTTTTPAAKIAPQVVGDVVRMGNVHVAGEAWRTPNYVVKGTGEVDIGVGVIKPIPAGLSIDAGGSQITAAAWTGGAYHMVGEYIYGGPPDQGGTVPGAILQVTSINTVCSGCTAVRGAPTGLSVVDPGYSNATAATNNASATMGTAAHFTGAGDNTITLTWSDILDGGSGVATVQLAASKGQVQIGSGATQVLFGSGAIVATNNIVTSGSLISGSNNGVLWPDGAGHYAQMLESGATLVLNVPDNTGALKTVFSYAGNQATAQPLFVQVSLKLAANTVALLPTCNATMQNAMAVATDVTTPTYNTAAVGGGSNRLPVFCDGSAWRAH